MLPPHFNFDVLVFLQHNAAFKREENWEPTVAAKGWSLGHDRQLNIVEQFCREISGKPIDNHRLLCLKNVHSVLVELFRRIGVQWVLKSPDLLGHKICKVVPQVYSIVGVPPFFLDVSMHLLIGDGPDVGNVVLGNT